MGQIIRLLAVLAFWLGTPAVAHAAIALEPCIAPISDAGNDAKRALAPPPLWDCQSPQTSFGRGDLAVRFEIAPVRADPADPLVLRTTSVWQDSARLVFRYADGTTESLAYSSADATRFMTVGAIFEFPIPTHAAPLTAIHAEIKDSANLRGILLGAELMTRSEADRIEHWLIALYAAFGGLSLALIAYNLSLWHVLRHRFQLVYCLMVGALAIYTFTSSGTAALLFPGLDNNDRLRLNYLFLALSAVAGFAFIRSFFGPRVFARRLDRAVWLAFGWTFGTTIAFVALAPWNIHLLDKLYFTSGIFLMSLVGPVVWQAWRQRNRYLGLFLLAWSAPIITAFARLGHGFNLIGYSFWLDNGNMIALMVESLLSTMLIVARLRELSTERDNAREREQTAMRLANSDPLTGMLNRRAFLHKAIGRSGRFRLMLIDIDHFKAINDRFGHDAGDEMLGLIAQVIQSCRPKGSLAVRLGGEEFALLVPMAHHTECNPERVLSVVRDSEMPFDTRVTVSIGFAEGQIATEADWRRLYRLADSALYRAKADGRDRVCRATDFAEQAVA